MADLATHAEERWRVDFEELAAAVGMVSLTEGDVRFVEVDAVGGDEAEGPNLDAQFGGEFEEGGVGVVFRGFVAVVPGLSAHCVEVAAVDEGFKGRMLCSLAQSSVFSREMEEFSVSSAHYP